LVDSGSNTEILNYDMDSLEEVTQRHKEEREREKKEA